MKKKTILVLLILTLSIYALNIKVQITAEENDYGTTSIELTPHNPIDIRYDSDFEVFPGSGTAEDPYVIEGYSITTTSLNGIYITDTTKYFTVRNCYVDADDHGIFIRNVAGGTATIINNTCSNGRYGISLEYSGSSTVANNTFTNCGLYIKEFTLNAYLSHIVENNWVNGKILGFYTNLDSTIIAEPVYGQLILVNCTNVTVRDQILNDATTGLSLYYCKYSTVINNTCSNNFNCGIRLYASGSSTFTNNMCNNNWDGILLSSSGNSTVTNNACSYNRYEGIYLWSSGNSTVTNNTCSYNRYEGIYLWSSGNSTVANNTCSNNGKGIKLYYSGNSTFTNNTCSNNNSDGILLSHSSSSTVTNNTCSYNGWGGIWLDYSNSSTVANNTCSYNYWFGIRLWSSNFCVVTYNLLRENDIYGIYLVYGSDNNLFHHNTFVDNNLGGTSQAYDDANNYWYDTETLEGNYWSDWSGTGSYSIDGSTSVFDLYPLDEPTVYLGPPVITNIIHSPSSPTELDTISINATVTSHYGVQSVTLYYRVNSGTWVEVSMTLISGDLYNVTIGSFAVSDIIEYYITAVDNSINHNEATEDNSGLYYSFTIDYTDPAINDVAHSPSTPTELDTVSINATVTDDSGIYSVTLYYKINNGLWQTISMTLVSGDLYNVTIGSFTASDTIEYFVSAIDNSSNHNEAINDNAGLFYSFTVSEVIPEFQTLSLLLPAITLLLLVFGLVVLRRRKK